MPLPHLACRHWELLGSHLYSPEEGRYKLEKYRKLDAFAIADPQLSVGKASIKAKGFYDDHADNRSEFITTRLEDILILCQVKPKYNDYPQSERRIWVLKQAQDDD